MEYKVFMLFIVLIMKVYETVTGAGIKMMNKTTNKVMCSEISKTDLSETLGSAFNSRYMSITEPKGPELDVEKYKRESDDLLSFYVEDTYVRETGDTPIWPWDKEIKQRRKRSTETNYQWKCQAKLHWIDLGPNYFPRYLRSVECVSKNCWYGMFKCRPRSFTVKLLRRKKDRCIAKMGTTFGMEGLPMELKEQWVWEEHAVNFCCDCGV